VAYLAGLSSIAIVVIGELTFVVDGGPHRDLRTLGSALLWSAATVLGMSPTVNPTTTAGQLVMVVGFVAGLVLITTLAGALGSYLLEARAESTPSTPTRQTTEQSSPAPEATEIEEP